MRLVKLAAGLAAGYVLGARAGREQYERIAAAARTVSGRPAEENAQAAPPPEVASVERTTPAVASDKPRRPRNRRPKTAAPATANLGVDSMPLEADEADVIEQHTPGLRTTGRPTE